MLLTLLPGVARGQAESQVWNLSLRLQESWHSNPSLSATPNKSWLNRAGAGLAYSRNTERSQLQAEVDAAAAGSFNQPQGGRFSYTGALAWTHQLAARTTLNVSDSLAATYSQGSPTLIDEGLVYPLVFNRTNRAGVALSQRLSPRTTLIVNARHDWVSFDDPALVGGSQFGAGVGLGRQLGPADDVSLGYRYRRSLTQGRENSSQDVTAGWTHRLNKTFGFNAALGASYLFSPAVNGSSWRAVGGVGVQGGWQNTTLAARYGRSVSQAFGYGFDRVADVFSLSWSRRLGRRLNASVAAAAGLNRDALDPDVKFVSQSYGVGLQHRTARRLSLSGGYSFSYSEPPGQVAHASHAVYLAASYGWQWR